jgi:SAM-dependent methyltransferase
MINTKTYEEKYKNGYGVQYPESHIIRFYEHFLKNRLDHSKKIRILDFGCGSGIHPYYFSTKGFEVYGVDISSNAIDKAKKQNIGYTDNFIVIKEGDSLKNIFDVEFDVVMANQSLYYLNNSQLQSTLDDIKSILISGGYFFATMMSTNNYYYNRVVEDLHNGLLKVELKGRLNETTCIKFIDTIDDLKSSFSLFEPMFTGKYDVPLIEGSGEHFYYMGRNIY